MAPPVHQRNDEPSNRDLMEAIERQNSTINQIKAFVDGGDSPDRGLIVRVDRIEQKQENSTFWSRAAIAGVVGAFVTSLWALLTTGKTH